MNACRGWFDRASVKSERGGDLPLHATTGTSHGKMRKVNATGVTKITKENNEIAF